jgi:hypothetical protein
LKAPEAKNNLTRHVVFSGSLLPVITFFFVLLYHQDLAMMVGGSG